MTHLKKLLLFSLVLGLALSAWGQSGVPDQAYVLETQITITPGGKKLIEEKMASLTRNQTYYNDYLTRCLSYFPIIERELADVGVPQDYKFLALQESALDGTAVSKSNAVGYWQFKAPTAEEYLLQIDPNVDERKNIVSSTRAAANYFQKSNHYLNNWVYSLLSYYTGLTGARNYIAENNLPPNVVVDQNTHYYIVHFLAHYFSFKDTYERQRNASEVYLVEYAGGINNNLDEIAQFVGQMVPNSGMQPGEYASMLKTYNPWLLTDRIPEGGQYCYSVILPLRPDMRDPVISNLKPYACGGKARGAAKNFYADTLKNMYPFIVEQEGLPETRQFKVVMVNGVKGLVPKKDVKTKKVLKKLDLSEADFTQFNDGVETPVLKANYAYYLEEKPETIPLSYHVVEEGEDLYLIAHQYGIRLDKLLEMNGLPEDYKPLPGDKIYFNPE